MNDVIMTTYNNCELMRNAAMSALRQDVGGVKLWVHNNGSTDQTSSYLAALRTELNIEWTCSTSNESPVKIANHVLSTLFELRGVAEVLCIPNDVVLPPNMYRKMLEWPRGIVTASMTPDPDFRTHEDVRAVSECTPMAVMLVRRWAYEAIMHRYGYFLDPKFFHYASDCDLALRMAACGIHGIQLDIPYFHVSSATMKAAQGEDREAMCEQANQDRETFKEKWGFRVDAYEYGQCAVDINFRGEAIR